MIKAPEKYDGIYFIPPDEGSGVKYVFFDLTGEYSGAKIGSTSIGDCWHVAFVKDNNGSPVFDSQFEAIFSDPITYLKNLAGSNIYGCIIRKTENSTKWFEKYVNNLMNKCTT